MVQGMSTMKPMISVKNLTKDYGDTRAVDEVTFTIDPGECIGLLGLNGAGKTTLLRMLSCLLTPTAGEILVAGEDVVEDSLSVRGKIGFLPENPPLYPEMSVGRYLAFAARLRGVPAPSAEARVLEAARRCQVDHKLDQSIETLSYGFRKRVGIAQAIIHQPPLVILDEPIAGLDPKQIVEMRELVRSLRGAHTVVLSSHNLPEVSQTCDRILVMHHARIVDQGSGEDLADRVGRGRGLHVQVRGGRDAVHKVLEGAPGVNSVKFQDEADGAVTFELSCKSDVRAEVAKAVVTAGLGLLSLSKVELGLESVFLKLTRDKEGQA